VRGLLAFIVFVIALPIALGPATSTVTRLLGGEVQHHCACGMKRGQCGCAECEHVEASRRDAKRVHKYVTVRSSCEDDDGVARAPNLPLVTPALAGFVLVSPPSVTFDAEPIRELRTQLSKEPSTPPPRA
jgi:hypothetical protein